MKHSESTFETNDGVKLYYQSWEPDGEARAAVAIVHGHGEHSGRYMNLVNCLVPAGYTLYGVDLRGYGHSSGQRGHIDSWSEYREDVHAFLQTVARQEPKRAVFLYGHSLGGLVVLEYVLHYPDGLAGVISSAPTVGEIGISPFLLLLGRLLSRIYPRFSLKTGLDVTALSRDPAVVQAYRNDPLVHSFATARLGTELASAREYTMTHAADLRVPLLLTYGSADRLAAPEGCRAFFDHVTFPDKTRLEYSGGYHESHNDIEYNKVMTDLQAWLDAHVREQTTEHRAQNIEGSRQ